MAELIEFSSGYKVATRDYMRRYFNKLKGKWDGTPRVAYLLPHFMRAPSPFTAAWRFSLWLTDYVDTIYRGPSQKEHYVLDFTGFYADTMVLMMKQLNPMKRAHQGCVDYNAKFYADIGVSDGILTDTVAEWSEDYAKDEKLSIDDEMLNLLDNLPIAIVRAVNQDLPSRKNGRLTHLTIATRNEYGRGKKRALQKNMKRIDESVRDQIWAEAVYMYLDQLDDHYATIDGYTVDADMNPAILYN